jgi:hypothetical protein
MRSVAGPQACSPIPTSKGVVKSDSWQFATLTFSRPGRERQSGGEERSAGVMIQLVHRVHWEERDRHAPAFSARSCASTQCCNFFSTMYTMASGRTAANTSPTWPDPAQKSTAVPPCGSSSDAHDKSSAIWPFVVDILVACNRARNHWRLCGSLDYMMLLLPLHSQTCARLRAARFSGSDAFPASPGSSSGCSLDQSTKSSPKVPLRCTTSCASRTCALISCGSSSTSSSALRRRCCCLFVRRRFYVHEGGVA